MRLTNNFSVMGRKYDLAFGQANIWKRKLKNYKYELIENAIDKLGQLEDIEEELGIELVKVCLFALNGGYYKGESPLATPTHISPTDIDVNFFFKQLVCYDNCLSLYFKDYGKTWALTKEELEHGQSSNQE